jgi:hypothetical protein
LIIDNIIGDFGIHFVAVFNIYDLILKLDIYIRVFIGNNIPNKKKAEQRKTEECNRKYKEPGVNDLRFDIETVLRVWYFLFLILSFKGT